jgi:histidinol dehydrogenase
MSPKIRMVNLADLSADEYRDLTHRSAVPDASVRSAAAELVRQVEVGGDLAVMDAASKFGGGPASGSLRVAASEIKHAGEMLDQETSDAITMAVANVRAVHAPQQPEDSDVEPIPGVSVARRWTPLQSVGVYVPGGRAEYPSSVIMGVVPAQAAGVERICIATPASADGTVSPIVLATADILGIDEVYAMGGAQAVAALAFGTESVPRVDKIVGPGGPWVTAAKIAVLGTCGIDLPAGPSEAAIVADNGADVRVVAADVMCQAEHGEESAVLVIVPDDAYAASLMASIDDALPLLERAETIQTALQEAGLVVVAPDPEDALRLANDWAPEHLSLHTRTAAVDVDSVPNAGSVFVGHWSPEAAGDYATGANHVLPTGGLARAYGPLSVEDFGSFRQVQTLTRVGLEGLASTIDILARAEGFTAHAYSVRARLDGTP